MAFKHLSCNSSEILVPDSFSTDECQDLFGGIRVDTPNRCNHWTRPFKEDDVKVDTEDLIGDLKFVLFEKHESQEIFPIVFTQDIMHSYLAESAADCSDDYCTPICAGFINFKDDSFFIYGRSESLDMDSNEKIAKKHLENLLLKK